MNPALATRTGELVDMGWRIKSQTDSSAALETRQPFNFLIFAVLLFFFFGIPAAIYVLFWLITSEVDVFLADKDGEVAESGDTWYVARQERDRDYAIERQRQIKEQGFWKVMWPSVLATVLMIGAWIAVIWFLFKWLDN